MTSNLPTKQQLVAMAVATIYSLGGRINTHPPSLELPDDLAFDAWVKIVEALELIRSLTAIESDERPVKTRRTRNSDDRLAGQMTFKEL